MGNRVNKTELIEEIAKSADITKASATRALDAMMEAVTTSLFASNVKIHTLDRYHLGPPKRRGIVLGYGVVDLPEIEHGLSQLHKMLLRAA